MVDVSFALYWLILLDIVILVTLNARIARLQLRFPILWGAVAFLASIALSVIASGHTKDVAYFFVVNLGALILFYAILNTRSEVNQLKNIIRGLVSLGIGSAALSVWQLYSPSFKFFYYPYIATRDELILELWEVVSRVVGTWQHPSYLGIYLAIAMPLAVWLVLHGAKSPRERIISATGFVLLGAVLLLTNTRSSVLSAGLGVIIALFIAGASGLSAGRKINLRAFAFVGLLAAASLLFDQFVFVAEIYTKPQAWRVDASATIWGRFLSSDSMSTESLVQRSQLYDLAWQSFKERPITGIGAKNFVYRVEGLFERGTDAHNLILQTAAETGIIGLFMTMLLYLSLLRLLWKTRRTIVPEHKPLFAALFAVPILIFFDSMFNNPLYSLRIVAVFWLICGLVISLGEPQKNAQNYN